MTIFTIQYPVAEDHHLDYVSGQEAHSLNSFDIVGSRGDVNESISEHSEDEYHHFGISIFNRPKQRQQLGRILIPLNFHYILDLFCKWFILALPVAVTEWLIETTSKSCRRRIIIATGPLTVREVQVMIL